MHGFEHFSRYSDTMKPQGLYFSKALFEGLIFAGAYIQRGLSTEGNLPFKIDWASLIVESKFTVFALFYFVFEGSFPSTSPRGAYIWRGNLTEGFFVAPVWGTYIWRGFFSEFYGIYHSRDNGILIAILVSTKLKKERKKRKEII